MINIDKSLESSTNKTIMMQQNRCSFIVNKTDENNTSPNNENVPHLKRSTPILFSTNRGLHIRLANVATTLTPNTTPTMMSNNNSSLPIVNSAYSIMFCDLERWSTNRANTISLEDTYTISKPPASSKSQASGNLRFLPQKTTSLHYNGYTRFDME